MPCGNCGSSIIEYDSAAGNAFCKSCGTVCEENTIVSEVTFLENNSGGKSLQGSIVAADRARAAFRNPYNGFMQTDSREVSISNARAVAKELGVGLRIPEHLTETAIRYYKLALQNNITRGRRSHITLSACLYIACRYQKTSHMLIDFSDLLQVSVFSVGTAFLKIVQTLCLPDLPLVDPSLYISRFASLLGFGEKTRVVIETASRVVKRMDRDWMVLGRRPAGICGAGLLIAARIHHFKRSLKDIISVVKMSEETIKKRLLEFSETPSGQLTVNEFLNLNLEDACDPPSFTKNKKKTDVEDAVVTTESTSEIVNFQFLEKNKIGSKLTELEPENRAEKDVDKAIVKNIEQDAEKDTENEEERVIIKQQEKDNEDEEERVVVKQQEKDVENEIEKHLISEVQELISNHEKLDSIELQPRIEEDLSFLDDDAEVTNMFLKENEVESKTQIWMDENHDYLEAQEAKLRRENLGLENGTKKRPKKRSAPKSKISADNPVDATLELMKQQKLSKKINYEAVKNIFTKPHFDSNGVGINPKKEASL